MADSVAGVLVEVPEEVVVVVAEAVAMEVVATAAAVVWEGLPGEERGGLQGGRLARNQCW